MSNLLLTIIRENIPEVKGPSRAVLMALADRADNASQCYPSHATIAKDAGVCVSTVKTALRKLRSAGFITWTNTTTDAGDAGSNIYHVMLEGRAGDAPPRAGDSQRRTAPAPRVGQDAPEGRAGAGHKASMEAPERSINQTADLKLPIEPISRPTATTAEVIYQAYPRHIKKDPALTAIRKAMTKAAPDFLLSKVQDYAAAMSGENPKFIPYPATWFNAGQYDDDPKEWNPTPPPPKSRDKAADFTL